VGLGRVSSSPAPRRAGPGKPEEPDRGYREGQRGGTREPAKLPIRSSVNIAAGDLAVGVTFMIVRDRLCPGGYLQRVRPTATPRLHRSSERVLNIWARPTVR